MSGGHWSRPRVAGGRSGPPRPADLRKQSRSSLLWQRKTIFAGRLRRQLQDRRICVSKAAQVCSSSESMVCDSKRPRAWPSATIVIKADYSCSWS